ncbi:Uma2 family endonuclease [Streptomyces filamentosus]|uniref:Uma2 family endonuclease n=2 Tax=Streptomyces filamentosus TaxID=67294 RepID=A0ABY4UZS9_STRFL|nr:MULTISPECIES: Uma2 family endonuclease [Streptomyces]EFE76636.1 integral membrane protein [Streptomyces filamentosus NRRL 15998]ESU51050.1 integral membrane protein [Streptomyces sp. HCCB10043]EWS93608.1 integral membrane protein [Streptomyces filamentosus NRRL 11379]MYR80609.1 Uma2 family endonuclease [Streptomyces sp. SID5466]USC47879.1 Uma2 family endonuclease [Streptomyces filamentosus]
MPAATADHPGTDEPKPLIEAANRLMDRLPGYRVEIIDGTLSVAPLRDGPHADALTTVMLPLLSAGLSDGDTEVEVLQAVGLWLPGGPQDFAIPDLAIVDADFDEHLRENNSYDPACFRLVLEVTSGNYQNDLRNKVTAYAQAKIPVYVIVDRKHGRVHVLTEPLPAGYDRHEVYAPGQQAPLPASIGAEVSLDVDEIVRAGSPKR